MNPGIDEICSHSCIQAGGSACVKRNAAYVSDLSATFPELDLLELSGVQLNEERTSTETQIGHRMQTTMLRCCCRIGGYDA